jgi:hypothetical protein
MSEDDVPKLPRREIMIVGGGSSEFDRRLFKEMLDLANKHTVTIVMAKHPPAPKLEMVDIIIDVPRIDSKGPFLTMKHLKQRATDFNTKIKRK